MSEIKRLMRELGLNECEIMNQLQDLGLVSDNAVNLEDCYEGDLVKASEWIREDLRRNGQ